MNTQQFDLIVFDWDGTLSDSTAMIARCIQTSCADLDLPVPSDRDASYVIDLNLRDALMHAAPTLPQERYGELALRYRTHYLARQHDLSLFDGALALLEELRQRRHLLAVATGKSRAGLDDALATTRLHGLFNATRTADETASKPHPRMLLELMDELGAEPARTLMIGDTTHDLQLAANAGAAGLAVAYGAHESAALAGLAPRHVVHSVAELRDWLAEHG